MKASLSGAAVLAILGAVMLASSPVRSDVPNGSMSITVTLTGDQAQELVDAGYKEAYSGPASVVCKTDASGEKPICVIRLDGTNTR